MFEAHISTPLGACLTGSCKRSQQPRTCSGAALTVHKIHVTFLPPARHGMPKIPATAPTTWKRRSGGSRWRDLAESRHRAVNTDAELYGPDVSTSLQLLAHSARSCYGVLWKWKEAAWCPCRCYLCRIQVSRTIGVEQHSALRPQTGRHKPTSCPDITVSHP